MRTFKTWSHGGPDGGSSRPLAALSSAGVGCVPHALERGVLAVPAACSLQPAAGGGGGCSLEQAVSARCLHAGSSMASFDEQIRQARREFSLADRAFQHLEESGGKDAVQINQLQEDVTRQVTAVRQTMNRLDGTIREAPASLRNPQEEMQAQQLNEKVVMLERGLDRFVGRNSSREREKQERCARSIGLLPRPVHDHTRTGQPTRDRRRVCLSKGVDCPCRRLQGVPVERSSAEGPE
jgi:hypothetical protein